MKVSRVVSIALAGALVVSAIPGVPVMAKEAAGDVVFEEVTTEEGTTEEITEEFTTEEVSTEEVTTGEATTEDVTTEEETTEEVTTEEVTTEEATTEEATEEPTTEEADKKPITPYEDAVDGKEDGVGAFVTRCYQVALDRQPDTSGYNHWVDYLKNGKSCGAHVAYAFLFGPEYQKKNKSNDEYVKDLYRLFFDREGDLAGAKHWKEKLAGGASRVDVFAGFANSIEFFTLCSKYSVTSGYFVTGIDNNKQAGINCFVARLYRVCLGRQVDYAGHQHWVRKFIYDEVQGDTGAMGFVFSPEYQAKQLTDEQFIENMYLAFFNRPADTSGKEHWMQVIKHPRYGKLGVFYGFTMSYEFGRLCESYGIKQTNYPVNRFTVPYMTYSVRWRVLTGGTASSLGEAFRSQAACDELMTTITVNVWDFENRYSMNKVTKPLTLRVNKYVAAYYAEAFEEIYRRPEQPVISPSGTYAYYYRANVNNPGVLSTHSFGSAIDINPAYNRNGVPKKSYEEWMQMPEGSIAERQAKAYTLYDGCPIVQVLKHEYSLGWGGNYSGTPDTMHFEFTY